MSYCQLSEFFSLNIYMQTSFFFWYSDTQNGLVFLGIKKIKEIGEELHKIHHCFIAWLCFIMWLLTVPQMG